MADGDIISADEVIAAEDGMAEAVIIVEEVSTALDALVISADDVSTAGDELIISAVAVPGA